MSRSWTSCAFVLTSLTSRYPPPEGLLLRRLLSLCSAPPSTIFHATARFMIKTSDFHRIVDITVAVVIIIVIIMKNVKLTVCPMRTLNSLGFCLFLFAALKSLSPFHEQKKSLERTKVTLSRHLSG